ncbi:DUF4277 domain-containing protein [Limnochorda pilosa]|uniref:Transposase IS4 n=1 Tax=Limnochorda pilosa TaxID=1555112 RepID=A0A0K2SGY6_LIMPI|nr:DUF4277 domain-containing protein [Limnochorda pilosa]BAS26094.1 transposase IS4 [Limnochorda pilosa]
MARLCQQLRIRPIVNAMVRWDPTQCKVSPGTLVVALIVNLLLDREPLYKVKEFYRQRDLGLLFEEPVDVEALNDDALGRALDRLAEIDLPQLLQTVGLSAVHLGEMEVRAPCTPTPPPSRSTASLSRQRVTGSSSRHTRAKSW